MSKKLLKESTIRRFGALANVNPNATSNFIQGLDEEEEEIAAIGDLDVEDEIILDPEEEEVEIEDSGLESVPADLTGVVKELVQVIADWAADQGVPVSVEGGDEEVIDVEDDIAIDDEEIVDLDIPAGEEEIVEPELELEEMIRQALSEATPEEEVIEEDSGKEETEHDEENAAADDERAAKLRKDAKLDRTDVRQEGRIQLSDDVIKEVTRRVKARVAKLYKSKKA